MQFCTLFFRRFRRGSRLNANKKKVIHSAELRARKRILQEAEILAAENKAVAEKLAAWRAAEAAYRAANKASARRELETRWVALCAAVEAARA